MTKAMLVRAIAFALVAISASLLTGCPDNSKQGSSSAAGSASAASTSTSTAAATASAKSGGGGGW